MRRAFAVTFLLILAACTSPAHGDDASPIDWDDGDSGTINGKDFRLAGVDAPETGGVGAAIGGAKCEVERALGRDAKDYMQALTRGAELEITADYAIDRYGRHVIDLAADGMDVGKSGLAGGHLRSWQHDGTKALEERPNWCE